MITIKAKMNAPMLDLTSYRNELDKLAREIISLSIFEYVVTATDIIPIWSGESHATFTELASLVGAPLIINASPTAFARSNGVSSGAAQGDGTMVADSSTGEYSFTYATTLDHLIYNESNNANTNPDPTLFGKLLNPGPYNFRRAASERVRKVFGTFIPPDLNKHIKPKKVV